MAGGEDQRSFQLLGVGCWLLGYWQPPIANSLIPTALTLPAVPGFRRPRSSPCSRSMRAR